METMSELIENRNRKKELLKHMILELHRGQAPEAVKAQLARLLGEVPYDDVVTVEQQLIEEGLPFQEVLRLCDIHSNVLKGHISQAGAKTAPPGHPAHTFLEENRALQWEIDLLRQAHARLPGAADAEAAREIITQIRAHLHALADVEKHYLRKENLLFPYMERHGLTGPPKVMWGKHDEARALLKAALEVVPALWDAGPAEAAAAVQLAILPAADAIEEMIYKEREILLPMCLDALEEAEWHAIARQSPEIGFCLYDPKVEWSAEGMEGAEEAGGPAGRVLLPTGSMAPAEIEAILNAIPFDLTFVDAEDRVRYFTQGAERIFSRSRAIIGRKVGMCHPPSSVDIVERIISDFKAGRASRAPFWINLKGRFIHIEYFALRDRDGRYLGTLEVSQDLTEKRALEGEQRLLSYAPEPGA
jgi:DUF438 domain-containing protein